MRDGVARGKVEDYDEENKYWRIRWETDKKVTDFDAEDMRKYCIERINGKSEADGGCALMLRARQKAIWEANQPAGAAVDNPNWYTTHSSQSWAEICGHCHVPSDKHREYLLWIRENHKLDKNDNAAEELRRTAMHSFVELKMEPRLSAETVMPSMKTQMKALAIS